VRRIAAAALLVALAVTSGACGPISWLVAVLAPPKRIPAVYELPEDKKVLVFVDDIVKPVRYEAVKRELTEGINDRLLKEKVAGETLPYEHLFRLIASRPDFNLLSIFEVGKLLGADLVVYVRLDEFSLKDSPNVPLWHGKLRTTVRVMDVSGKPLWPLDRPAGHVVEVEMPEVIDASNTYGTELASQMAERMAERIARLFHTHYVPRDIWETETGAR